MMSKTSRLKAAIAWAGLALAAAPVGAQAPADYSAFPCLSYTLDCGKLATRKPQVKTLEGTLNGNAEKGKQITQARNRGNCLACHVMAGGSQPGTRGPDLSHYGSTSKTDAEIYASVWDMRTLNPDTLMPPFGTNEVLTDQELRDVVAYLRASK
ncbi:MAG: sulfur oxidation c-type cytochrome SoxX [Polynucleobacter sp.]|nr:sulfur oxidation c-type cytochrome SoxX [Polynucleobacter sp.]